MKHDTGHALACLPQSKNWLEDRRSEDDEMPRRVEETIKTKVREVRMAKIKEKRKEERRRK